MYDTISISFPFSEIDFEKIKDTIDRQQTSIDDEGVVIRVTGWLKNLWLTYNGDMMRIRGSLSGFYFGSNFKMLTFSDAKAAIEELTDILNISPQTARLSEVHFAINLSIPIPCRQVLKLLGELNRKSKKEFFNGVEYSATTSSLLIYDKKKEMSTKQRNNKNIPPDLSNSNILRIELKLKKLSSSKFKSISTLSDLMNEKNFNYLFEETKKLFLQIDKKKLYSLNDAASISIKTLPVLKNYINANSLRDEQFTKNLMHTLELNHKGGTLPPKNFGRMKKYIKTILESKKIMETYNPLAGIEKVVSELRPLISSTDIGSDLQKYFYEYYK